MRQAVGFNIADMYYGTLAGRKSNRDYVPGDGRYEKPGIERGNIEARRKSDRAGNLKIGFRLCFLENIIPMNNFF